MADNVALPNWVKVGAPGVLITGGFGPPQVTEVTIDKITKVYVVAGGRRYSIKGVSPQDEDLYPTGDDRYRRPNLNDPHSKRAVAAIHESGRAAAARKVSSLVAQLDKVCRHSSIDVAPARKALDELNTLFDTYEAADRDDDEDDDE